LYEFGHGSQILGVCSRVAILDNNVFPFYVAEISEPAPEGLDDEPRIVDITTARQISYPWDLSRLLRLGGQAKR
jgi:hypothetical protein